MSAAPPLAPRDGRGRPLRPGERLLLAEAAARLGISERELRARLVWERYPLLAGVRLALATDADREPATASGGGAP